MNEQATPTTGPWTTNGMIVSARVNFSQRNICELSTSAPSQGERYSIEDHLPVLQANAALIAEAGTVYHETGLTPRQLAEQRKELLCEMQRYSILLERAESDPATWEDLTQGTGIATLNGWRAALAHAHGEKQP